MKTITKIAAMTPDGKVMALFDSPKDAAQRLGLRPCAEKRIHSALCYKNQNDYAYGYCWGFKEVEVEDLP